MTGGSFLRGTPFGTFSGSSTLASTVSSGRTNASSASRFSTRPRSSRAAVLSIVGNVASWTLTSESRTRRVARSTSVLARSFRAPISFRFPSAGVYSIATRAVASFWSGHDSTSGW